VVDQSPTPEEDERTLEDELRHRLRHGQTDLDQAIALLRSLDLGDMPPAADFDPSWGDDQP
jgi:hypothetical protein